MERDSPGGPLIAALLPGAVETVEAFGDPADAVLLPEEEPYVAGATAVRRAEFAAARSCAREALARLGLPPSPIPVGDRGAPVWPRRVTGSLTHTAGYRAAAVARTSDLLAVGIDAEPHAPLPDGVEAVVATEAERRHLAELRDAHPGVHWDRLLFCAKESTYKAWFPLARRWLGFADAAVTFDPGTGTFTTALLVRGPDVDGRTIAGFDGRWSARDGLALTAVAVTP